jgi:DNA-binding transcriptional LysR family regulator
MSPTGAGPDAPLRIGFVPGVTPGKWLRIWGERMPRSPLVATMVSEAEAASLLHEGAQDMCFVRLPVEREGLHLITLYAEVPVAVLPKDHELTLLEELSTADLVDELVLEVSPALTAKQAIETVAAGTGVVLVPMSVARLHQRKDVVARPLTDLPETVVGLAWQVGDEDPRLETFIGIVRGRTAQSSRQQSKLSEAKKPAPKKVAPKKTAGRAVARQRSGTKRRRR